MVKITRVFVTGCAGYIGYVLTKRLLDDGFDVVCVDRLLYDKSVVEEFLGHPGFRLVEADVREYDPTLLKGCDVVLDLAAIAQPDPKGLIPESLYMEINYKAAVRTANLAKKHGVEKYVFTSTCSVYGAQPHPVDENSPVNPLEAYARSKVLAEREILPLNDKSFTVTILRLATVYGLSKRMRFDLVVNAMTLSLFERRVIRVSRPGTQVRPVVHVKDVVEAIRKVMDADKEVVAGEVFNVGSNEQNYRIIDLAREIGDAVGVEYRIEYYGEPDTRSYFVKFDKIRRVLGFETRYTVADGAREVYAALERDEVKPGKETRVVEWVAELVKKGLLR